MIINKYNQKGATLTEIIIVVTIISALVLIFISFFRTQIFKGNDARRKGDLARMQVAVEEYEKDNSCYPLSNLVTCSPGTGLRPYIDKLPCDPISNASYYYEYEDTLCPGWYRIYSVLENSNDKDYTAGAGPDNAFNYFVESPNAPSGTVSVGEGEGTLIPSEFYGCKSSVCVPIMWDTSRPGPECDPNFQNANCYGVCSPANECSNWQ